MTRGAGRVSRRVKDRARAEAAFGLPVVTEIPVAGDGGTGPEVEVTFRPESASSRAYRQLATDIGEVVQRNRSTEGADGARRHGTTLLVTSARDEPARSFVAVNLAALYADGGDRVIVATTRGLPAEHDESGGARPAGSESGRRTTPESVIALARPSWIPGVSSVALGDLFEANEDLLGRFDEFADAACDLVDVLVLEAPLLSSPVGPGLLSRVDLVVVVCECGRTATEDAFESQRLVTADGSLPLLGLVLANAPA